MVDICILNIILKEFLGRVFYIGCTYIIVDILIFLFDSDILIVNLKAFLLKIILKYK